jgi:putative transposase
MLRRHQNLAFPASIHFVTTVTAVRGDWFVEEALCRRILEIIEAQRERYALHCLGYALMPDHLHAVLYQDKEVDSVPIFMRRFKTLTSLECRPVGYLNDSLWRRRYDDVPLPGPAAVRTRLEYMHANPVRRGLVGSATEYPWSSARELIGEGSGIVQLSRELLSGL